MPKDSFLFVPYHTGQQSLADIKLASSDARSHAAAVSRQRRDNRKLRAQLGHTKSTSVATAVDQSTSGSDGDIADHNVANSGSSLEDSPPIDTVNGNGKAQRRQHMRAMQFSWRAGNVSSDLKLCNGTRTDPFGYVPSTCFGRAVVDYFYQVISPVNQPIYAIFNVTNIYTSYWMELMQHDDYKPAGMAMVGAIMQKVLSQEVALRKKSKLAKPPRSLVYRKMVALASLARLTGDMSAYQVHRNSLLEMVRARGGVEDLGHDGLAKCVLLQWDSFWVFETAGTPLLTESRSLYSPVYPAFPLSADLQDAFLKVPAGFQLLVLKGKISVEMVEILGRATEANEGGVQGLSKSSMHHSERRKYNDFVEACPSFRDSDHLKVTIEKEISLALLLYCFNAFTNLRSNTALFAGARTELTRLLLQENEELYTPPERECLYWVCAVCVDSWRQASSGVKLLPTGKNLLPILKRMRNGFETTNTLQRFLYNQDLLDVTESFLRMEG